MNDYSEVTCHTQRDVVNLINALNEGKWQSAYEMSEAIAKDMNQVRAWVYDRIAENRFTQK